MNTTHRSSRTENVACDKQMRVHTRVIKVFTLIKGPGCLITSGSGVLRGWDAAGGGLEGGEG